MSVKLFNKGNGIYKVELDINLDGLSMLDAEVKIQEAVNGVGKSITQEKLSEFDTDGSPIRVGDTKLTSKGLHTGRYETPYGQVEVDRHLYQSYKGGKTYCPLNSNARIIKKTCTPKFAKSVSNKYANMAAGEVISDLEENHSRKIARSLVQNIGEFVGTVVEAKEETWDYEMPKLDADVATVGISCDGANILILKDGYREAMTGSISLYDKLGNRLHTMYLATEPEYGKGQFFDKMDYSINKIKAIYKDATYIGVSDGAKDLCSFLRKHTDIQTLDFYHASEYLASASYGFYPKNKYKRKEWLDTRCSKLKNKIGSAKDILKEMNEQDQSKLKGVDKDKLNAAITYFTNNYKSMTYKENLNKNLPIGSGVIEAACKTIVKSRMCRTGMKWKSKGVKIVLSLRSMVRTDGKWNSFWNKINAQGVPDIA